MELSKYEKKRRQHEKELNSFRNKMGSNIVWFNSLPKGKQYDILFGWKRTLHRSERTKPEYVEVLKRVPVDPKRPYGRTRVTKVMELRYPPSLKHFIKDCKKRREYQPRVQNIRHTAIDLLLKEK